MGSKVEKDLKVLEKFIQVYCETKHSTRGKPDPRELCEECSKTLDYSIHRREVCPLDPKPTCKKCPTHCFAPFYRQRIRQVMRFSGMHLIKRGRLDLITRYLW